MPKLNRRLENQRSPIVAPALPGRLRTVIEDVTVMTAAAHAVVFGARIDQLEIGFLLEHAGKCGEKTRPTGADRKSVV